MELFYFIRSSLRGTFITIMLGMAAFAVILVTTLNITTAFLAFLFFVAAAIFQKSFSRGWLFMLAILLIFPSMKISGTTFSVHDIFLVILGIIGLGMILMENLKIPLIPISFEIFLLELVGSSILFFAKLFGYEVDPLVWSLMVLLAMYWVIMTSFQFYFQTKIRLKRFFLILITISVIHSIFGLIAFSFGLQTPAGMGISSGKLNFLFFGEIEHQINGFLGDGYALRIGANALAPFLLATIPLTFCLVLGIKKKQKPQRPLKKLEKTINSFKEKGIIEHFMDQQRNRWISISEVFNKEKIFNLMKSRSFLIAILTIQIIGLIFTFSYISLVIVAIGFFTCGLLLRSKKVLSITAVIIIALTLIIPASNYSGEDPFSSSNQWLGGWEQVRQHAIMGSGWIMEGSDAEAGLISNSYLLVWDRFGLLGLVILLLLLWKYLKTIYSSYRNSDNEKRFWLIGIIAVFFEFIFLGLTNNALLEGPAALIFWLLFVAGYNLRRRDIIFGITETQYSQDKLINK